MSEFTIDTYYDITCAHCSRNRSSDFSKGKYASTLHDFSQQIYSEGWRVIDDKNVCPICSKLNADKAWVSVGVKSPPTVLNRTGIESKTVKTYVVITKECHTVRGYIYNNPYSCSGYAVYLGGDSYLNNVTHWVPDETVWDEDK